MLAGLSGYTITGLVFIRLLWTDPSLRGQGIGDALMRKAEDAGIERGCVSMFVDTMSFQAPSFYRRLGYKEIYSIERCWGLDIQRIYFQKDLQIQANSY
ncbi:acetyltransferase family protein [Tilletiaria anomala UBC 951]|uniref:Acetyltransferase family protein n=1 Tax=Tilletiaria anomala (strain ATCC 24038 / CBS 436.72 / UBC 951) TaxID=1037660 RepID=A0A066VCK0_TILAU|nr:acetyltransferase family protein [Tilletiaria anomala UBC 951]KDN39462.1 acetyltransferase family protein [Tilletiaria anomala UBC 951]